MSPHHCVTTSHLAVNSDIQWRWKFGFSAHFKPNFFRRTFDLRLLPAGLAVMRQTAGIKFTQRPKISIFCPAGATRCTESREIWHDRGSASPSEFSPQSVHGVGTRPQSGKFLLFGKGSPCRANPLTDFNNC